MTIVDELKAITLQRPLAEVAAECDKVFADNTAKFQGDSEFAADPFKAALDYSRKRGLVVLAIFDRYFVKVIGTDARWMQALRLYQELKLQSERAGKE